MIHPGVIY